MAALAKRIASPEAEGAEPSEADEIVQGLSASPKRIAPKFFYDSEGSRLFDEITRLPEYYPTRSEVEILAAHAKDIAALLPDKAALIEFGSGASTKARILLRASPQVAAYVPVDISRDFLEREAADLRRDFPQLTVRPVAADFTKPFALPDDIRRLPHAGFFPGSTIGNFEPHEACAFLQHARRIIGAGGLLIIGVDLIKDREVLHAAYNDSRGVTEQFNLNLLQRLNREFGADFNPAAFEHHAFYNRERNRIEMHLASLRRQKVRIAGSVIDFRSGETIHTENSYKYSPESFLSLARGAGWLPVTMWTDARKYFSVHVLRAGGVG